MGVLSLSSPSSKSPKLLLKQREREREREMVSVVMESLPLLFAAFLPQSTGIPRKRLSSSMSLSSPLLRLRPSSSSLHFRRRTETETKRRSAFRVVLTKTSRTRTRTHTHSSSDERSTTTSEGEELQLVTAIKSRYNDIKIVDTSESRVLLLDSTYNVHSIFNKERKWTDSYWDEFASLPMIVPEGPIAILGLGGGTCAHLMLDLWPSLKLEAWEIDEILIDKAREYLGLSDLENYTQSGGVLSVHVGDALSPSVFIPGGFAGIVVDLFAGGKVLPQLQEATTWIELKKKLMPHGRIMVNCGKITAETTDWRDGVSYHESANQGFWEQNSTIKAMRNIFPENLSWKILSENYLALTGPFPDLDAWSAAVPEQLRLNVKQWRPC